VGTHVSLVVIAYNEAKNIGRTLDAITTLIGLGEYEVIVVNDGSRDETAKVVSDRAARNPRIKLIDLSANRGRGYARSTGIAAAEGELIATVDADIVLPDDWFVLAEAELSGYDAVGGTAVPDGDAAYVHQVTRLVPRVVRHTTAVTGSNALYRREVFDVVGFDPTLRDGEDVALNQATKVNGLTFATVAGLLVEHIEHKTFTESMRWLFTSGKGASRQLLAYRQIRVPDLAAGTFVASAATGASAAVLISPYWLALPALLLALIGARHVHSRFETPLPRWRSVAAAVAIDAVLLLAYFTGRVVGLTCLLRRWPDGDTHLESAGGTRDAGLADAVK
jgi:cellulose synthase/poly-beta-1,6-N-acetylglucosamine synthase-like glycosyltransferase